MSNINPQVEEELEFLNSRIAEEEYKAEQYKMLTEMYEDPKFKMLILEDYMEGEAERITSAITTPDGMKREHIQTAMDKLLGIRHLRTFLSKIEIDSHFATETLQELKETRDDVKANPEKYISTEEG